MKKVLYSILCAYIKSDATQKMKFAEKIETISTKRKKNDIHLHLNDLEMKLTFSLPKKIFVHFDMPHELFINNAKN